jgi:hypothetical protein
MENLLEFLFTNVPLWLTIPAGLSILLMYLFMNYKKIDQSDKEFQNSRMHQLMDQIKILSAELEDTRKQISELHEQNIELMGQLRVANLRISELEISSR